MDNAQNIKEVFSRHLRNDRGNYGDTHLNYGNITNHPGSFLRVHIFDFTRTTPSSENMLALSLSHNVP